jgi:2-haloacid dehalogenase
LWGARDRSSPIAGSTFSERTIPITQTSAIRYPWLLLDADGTLFDYERAEAAALAQAFADSGLPYTPRWLEVYKELNQEMWLAFERGKVSVEELRIERFRRLSDALGLAIAADLFSERYLARLGERTDLIDGAEELLGRLHGQVHMVLITNGLQTVQRSRLAHSTLAPYLADIVISEEVGAAKPDPRIFDAAFEKMGRPARQEVLIVGDSLTSDVQGGNRYGIDTCWYNPHGLSHSPGIEVTYEIRALDELPGIIGLH